MAPKKIALLAMLYITQGVAPGFSVTALPVLLRVHGLSLAAVGLAGLLTWPWTLKFLWGPVLDRYYAPWAGRRKTWIIPLQLLLSVGLMTVGMFNLQESLWFMLMTVCAVNLVATVLDAATDGLAAEILQADERGVGNSAQIGGFYVGSLLGGGAFLLLEPTIGWGISFFALGSVVCVGLVGAFLIREPRLEPTSFKPHYWNFTRRAEVKYILIIIVALNLGEHLGNTTINLFLVDIGLSREQIGFASGTLGLGAAMIGAFTGGVLVTRIGHNRSLVLFGACQTVAMLGYLLLSLSDTRNLGVISSAICVQYFFGNLFNVALYAWFMDWTSTEQAATDFSIMACFHNATSLLAAPLGGLSAQYLGYSRHFLVSVLVSSIGIVLASWLLRKRVALPRHHLGPLTGQTGGCL